jgi:hypothetical protein
MLGVLEKPLIVYLRAQLYEQKNGAGYIFISANVKCEFIPKPPYLSGIVTYEDDHTAILHSELEQIHFAVSNIFSALIFSSNLHHDVMISPPQQASN